MNTSESHDDQAICTVSQLAKKLRLSRARFYQLLKQGVFPPPAYSCTTRQPLYPQRLQEVCLTTRKTGIGINGQPVRFYDRRKSDMPNPDHKRMTATLRGMGLAVTVSQVRDALDRLRLPSPGNGHENPEIIRTLFKHLHNGCQSDV